MIDNNWWFRSVFDAIKHGKMEVTYDELINNMIIDAWYEKCMKKHLNDNSVRNSLYIDGLNKTEFTNRLENVVRPVYKAAINQGSRYIRT